MKRLWLLLVALALLAVILLVEWNLDATDDGLQITSQPATQAGSTPLDMQWRYGVAQQYRVLSDSSMHTEATTNSRSSIAVRLRCLLDTFTLEVTQDGAIIGMKCSSVELKINDAVDTGTNHALSAPFRVHFTQNGMPVAFYFPAEVSTQHRIMLENLVRMFQISIDQSDTWMAHESNSNGSYEAAYRRSGPLQVDKSKRNFNAPSESIMSGAKITSTEQFHIDPAYDWIIRMSVNEKLETSSQNAPAMTITNYATLELQEGLQTTINPDIWRFEVATANVDGVTSKEMQSVPDLSTEEASKQIQSTILKLDSAEKGRITLVRQLSDLLRVDESLPAALLNTLQTQPLSDRTRADLYLVFESAGTDSAQSALVSVFTDNSSWSMQDSMRAIVAMAGVDRPSNESIEALWSTAQNVPWDSDSQRITSASTFALGSLGNSMRANSNPDYDSLRSSLLDNALNGVNDQQRRDFVFALGNTQDQTLANEIVNFLDDDIPSIRRATALSLGMLGTDQVADTLTSKYQQENNSQVRAAIIESLASWSQPTASAMGMFRESVKTEADEKTRYSLVILLGKNINKFPENKGVLKEMMRSESSKRIRQKAATMLSGL